MARRTVAPRPSRPALTFDDGDVEALGAGHPLWWDDVLGPVRAVAAYDHVRAMVTTGALRSAHVGRGADRRLDAGVRGDAIAWLDLDAPPAPLAPAIAAFGALMRRANEAAWLGLRRFDVQVAFYPGLGVGYARHFDAFRGGPSRRLTAVYYLNPGWLPADGGALRVFPPHAAALELAPRMDRLVTFLSERTEHEVLPVHSPRFAVTAWYYP